MTGASEKIDRRKELAEVYTAKAAPRVVDVPAIDYLMIDGAGDPNTSKDFANAVEALYSVSYTLKFTLRNGPGGLDYAVMPLEGLWWADDMAAFATADRKSWQWTLMIAQPPGLKREAISAAIDQVRTRKPQVSAVDNLRFERWTEGRSAQLLHIGPYNTEAPNIVRLHEFIAALPGRMTGKHHEIYLNDMRRTAPERLKTIIRQPFSPGK